MAEAKTNYGGVGRIQINDEVIAIIAGTAALEVDGVYSGSAGNKSPADIASSLVKKNFGKGVKVAVDENGVGIDINLFAKFGQKLQDVCLEAQKRVKNAVETMTGLRVTYVNISVAGVVMEKEKPVKAEKAAN